MKKNFLRPVPSTVLSSIYFPPERLKIFRTLPCSASPSLKVGNGGGSGTTRLSLPRPGRPLGPRRPLAFPRLHLPEVPQQPGLLQLLRPPSSGRPPPLHLQPLQLLPVHSLHRCPGLRRRVGLLGHQPHRDRHGRVPGPRGPEALRRLSRCQDLQHLWLPLHRGVQALIRCLGPLGRRLKRHHDNFCHRKSNAHPPGNNSNTLFSWKIVFKRTWIIVSQSLYFMKLFSPLFLKNYKTFFFLQSYNVYII